jgi:hypothetical protein
MSNANKIQMLQETEPGQGSSLLSGMWAAIRLERRRNHAAAARLAQDNRIKARRPELSVLYMSGYPGDLLPHHGVLQTDTLFASKAVHKKRSARLGERHVYGLNSALTYGLLQ